MSWTCPGHYKVHVHGRDSPGRPVHGHCPVPLPALLYGTKALLSIHSNPSYINRNSTYIIATSYIVQLLI